MRFTREGIRFILAIILIGIASLNTANNLMYLIFSVMVSSFILSILLAFINIRGIEVDISTPRELFVKQASEFMITLKNYKFIPSYSLEIEMDKIGRIYIDRLEKRVSTKKFILTPQRRGISGPEVTVKTGFPFIFTEIKRRININRVFLIYPEIIDMEHEIYVPQSDISKRIRREGDEFIRIREYRHGDEKRLIDWKATAKVDKLMVREYARNEAKTYTIILDNYLPPDRDAFERSISFAASLAELSIRRDFYLRFVTCHKTIPYGSGREHLYRILDLLAMIEPVDKSECMVKEIGDGFLILQSDSSPLTRFRPYMQKVIYATEL